MMADISQGGPWAVGGAVAMALVPVVKRWFTQSGTREEKLWTEIHKLQGRVDSLEGERLKLVTELAQKTAENTQLKAQIAEEKDFRRDLEQEVADQSAIIDRFREACPNCPHGIGKNAA